MPAHDRLSQVNVLLQLDNLRGYPAVGERVASGTLGLHAWWFNLHKAGVTECLWNFLAQGGGVVLRDDAEVRGHHHRVVRRIGLRLLERSGTRG
jgi:hypothetical protein